MIKLRLSEERGYEDKGWLQSYHTFSFDTYYDREYLGYHQLRVINEDYVKERKGFASHAHKDMEILTYVIEGVLEHQDNMGNTSIIRQGEVQRMSAGTGIVHSEYNLSSHIPLHFLQIWIIPEKYSLSPSYSTKTFSNASKWGQWCLIASYNERAGSLRVHQDISLYATILENQDEIAFDAMVERYYWLQVVSGHFLIENAYLKAGDGAEISQESEIKIKCLSSGELLLFDLP